MPNLFSCSCYNYIAVLLLCFAVIGGQAAFEASMSFPFGIESFTPGSISWTGCPSSVHTLTIFLAEGKSTDELTVVNAFNGHFQPSAGRAMVEVPSIPSASNNYYFVLEGDDSPPSRTAIGPFSAQEGTNVFDKGTDKKGSAISIAPAATTTSATAAPSSKASATNANPNSSSDDEPSSRMPSAAPVPTSSVNDDEHGYRTSSGPGGIGTGAIIGIAVGGAAFVAIVGLIYYCVARHIWRSAIKPLIAPESGPRQQNAPNYPSPQATNGSPIQETIQVNPVKPLPTYSSTTAPAAASPATSPAVPSVTIPFSPTTEIPGHTAHTAQTDSYPYNYTANYQYNMQQQYQQPQQPQLPSYYPAEPYPPVEVNMMQSPTEVYPPSQVNMSQQPPEMYPPVQVNMTQSPADQFSYGNSGMTMPQPYRMSNAPMGITYAMQSSNGPTSPAAMSPTQPSQQNVILYPANYSTQMGESPVYTQKPDQQFTTGKPDEAAYHSKPHVQD
ncbi:uncharacterized protein BYT42DRAFT_642519 [Radiomyces spectabilis]|uniref:uncharacterized protein n=1 Tax=Radiomyces spectabilis TaxID=64574 RepID=UPI00221EB159|nr:uncharacterized protein BYT42DRAFT_642519 [Radiomyces spectabilis]KAI8388264.1 hypothetical protein BYT42DRAFT_642519 [Radiomyces spectabilis]